MPNSVQCFSQIFQMEGLRHLAYDIINFIDIDTLKLVVSKTKKASEELLSQISSNQQHNCSSISVKPQDSEEKKQKTNKKQAEQSGISMASKKKMSNDLVGLIKRHIFIKEYLNKADRSMYFSFYEEPQFLEIQQHQIRQVILNAPTNSQNQQVTSLVNGDCKKQLPQKNGIINNSNKSLAQTFTNNPNEKKQHLSLQVLPQCIQKIFELLQQEVQMDDMQLEEIRRIFEDPSIPMPKMKRQNQGIYCNSSFQLFLVSLRFPHSSQDNMGPSEFFPEMYEKIIEQEDIYLKRFLEIQKNKHIHPEAYQSIHMVRYTPYEITFDNYESFLLEEHHLHNCIIYLFALTELYLNGICEYLDSISDPTYVFVELMARYSNFRSFVMEFEESLGFIFGNYQILYADTIRDSIASVRPDYCFWRPAMTKWYNLMSKFHPQASQICFQLTTKLRASKLFPVYGQDSYENQEETQEDINSNSLNELFKSIPSLKSHEISIKNSLRGLYYEFQASLKVSQAVDNSAIDNFFEQNAQNSEVLIAEYVEYMIDLSINQQTVHWCGHSKNELEKPYQIFNKQFRNYNLDFCKFLEQSITAVQSQQKGTLENVEKFTLNKILQNSIDFLDQKNLVKPVTLRQLVAQINQRYKFDLDSQISEEQIKGQNNQQTDKVEEICLLVKPITLDFKLRDQSLNYFNEKAKIVQQIQEDSKCFFSISPLLSPQEILIKSIDTSAEINDSDSNSDNNSSFQYMSQNQDDEQTQQLPSIPNPTELQTVTNQIQPKVMPEHE